MQGWIVGGQVGVVEGGGGAAHQVQVEMQVVEGGAAHQVHLRLAQHPAPTGRQLGLWNKPRPLIMLQNPDDPTLK